MQKGAHPLFHPFHMYLLNAYREFDIALDCGKIGEPRKSSRPNEIMNKVSK